MLASGYPGLTVQDSYEGPCLQTLNNYGGQGLAGGSGEDIS